jgi:hypothetical protein
VLTLVRAARDLTRTGQPVFPCKTSGERAKAPYTRNGLKDATLDLDRIKYWWRQQPDAAIGLPTGIIWDVLDVDIKDTADGRVHLPMLNRLGLLNGCKDVVRTPSGGWHLYFPSTKGLTNKARGATLGLDVRGLGGYVLAPPSYIETLDYAGAYESVGAPTGGNDDPLHWDLIVSSILPIDTSSNKPVPILGSERQTSLAALREWVADRQSGERNNALHWAVCRCIDNGLDPHELVEPALLTGLSEDEILLTINSALKRAGVTVEELDSEAEALFPDEA